MSLRESNLKRFIVFFVLGILSYSSFAEENSAKDGNNAAENAIDDQHIMMRQPHTVAGYEALSVAGQQIDAAFLDDKTGTKQGVVVLFHDKGDRYDNTGVIHTLRHALPEFGWATLTLALDMPIEHDIMLSPTLSDEIVAIEGVEAETSASQDEVNNDDVLPPVANLERIEAALAMLQAKGFERVIFLGHGKGADVAIEMLSSTTMPISGLIFVGMADVAPAFVQGIEIPVLDIYGAQDLKEVLIAVPKRQAIMTREEKTDYAVREVVGANHRFYGASELLIMTVRSWLRRQYQQ